MPQWGATGPDGSVKGGLGGVGALVGRNRSRWFKEGCVGVGRGGCTSGTDINAGTPTVGAIETGPDGSGKVGLGVCFVFVSFLFV